MERFADSVESGLVSLDRFSIASMTVRPIFPRRLTSVDRAISIMLRYPLTAHFQTADVYHILDHSFGHVAALLPRRRTMATCHDLMLLRAEEGVAGFRGARRAVAGFRWKTSFLRRLAFVACDSETTRRDLVRLCEVDPTKTLVIPIGVSPQFRPLLPETRQATRQSLSALGERLILHVSSGGPYKNVEATLNVLALLRRGGIEAILLRAGRPLSRTQHALAEDLGVVSHVRELGNVSDETLVKLYGSCDAFLFPSHYEGFGLPVLEAMACGAPTVTSTCGALLELVGESALTAEPEDFPALAGCIARILGSEEVSSALRRAGLERSAEYTWDRTAQMYAATYADILRQL